MATRQNPPPDPSAVLHSINEKNEAVRTAVSALSLRIEQFQTYLSKLPGRVETFCDGSHPDDCPEGGISLTLRLYLNRDGKDWSLKYATIDDLAEAMDQDAGHTVHPLVDAPLRIKMAAVQMFPDLLQAIVKSQEELAATVTAVTSEYDKFARAANIYQGLEWARHKAVESVEKTKKEGK